MTKSKPSSKQVTDEWVVDKLAECLRRRPNYPSPDEGAVRHLTIRVNKYLAHPWDKAGIEKLRVQAKAERAENADLRKAAAILRKDLAGWRELLPNYDPGSGMRVGAEQNVSELEIAIARLEAPRGWLDHPGLAMRLSDRGKDPEPWALMAAGIAEELIRVLRDGGDSRAGVGGPDGPVTCFLAVCLGLLIPADEMPSHATISDTVANHLKITLRYQRS